MSNTSSKKDRVKNSRKSGRKTAKPFAIVAIVAIVAGIGIFVATRLSSNDGPSAAAVRPATGAAASSSSAGSSSRPVRIEHREIESSQIQNGSIVLATADFSDGTAQYFRQMVSGTEVKFFVLKSSDGVLRAAFDACDVCYQARRGYRQEGDFMVCNNCGQRFASVKVNEEKGGCNPSPLDRVVDGSNLVIDLAALSTGLYLF